MKKKEKYFLIFKKSVTPLIAVLLLLLITLFLSGTVMVLVTNLSKESEAKIKHEMTSMSIRGVIKNPNAIPNSEDFQFVLISYFNRRLPVDNINTRLTLYVNNYPIICSINSSVNGDTYCYCYKVLKKDREISLKEIKEKGLLPNIPYTFYCKNTYKPFNLVDQFKIGWFYLEDMRLLDLKVINVG